MKVLIDANVAITYISGRDDPFSSEIEKIMRLCAEEKIEVYCIAFPVNHLVCEQKSSG